MKTKDYSVVEKLIVAAFLLDEEGKRIFSAEDLVVKAWNVFPETFGLAGQTDNEGKSLHPDSNRVFAEIMGSKPIRKRGYLLKVGEKQYQLTEAGIDYARIIRYRSAEGTTTKKSTLAREIKNEIRRLLSSRAIEKVKGQNLGELTFHDACSFWQISPRSSAIEVSGKLAKTDKILSIFEHSVNENRISFEHGGSSLSMDDIKFLFLTNNTLKDKFKEEIGIIMQRTDER
jgi:hypothetical protein